MGVESRAIYNMFRSDCGFVIPLEMQAPAALLSAKARNLFAGNKSGAAGFRFAQNGGHQAMTIDDAGGRRKKSARALQRWFNLANLGWLKPAQIVAAIGRRQGPDAFSISQFPMFTGKDELAAPDRPTAVQGKRVSVRVAPD